MITASNSNQREIERGGGGWGYKLSLSNIPNWQSALTQWTLASKYDLTSLGKCMPIPCSIEPSTEYAHSFHLRVKRVAEVSVHMHNLIYRVSHITLLALESAIKDMPNTGAQRRAFNQKFIISPAKWKAARAFSAASTKAEGGCREGEAVAKTVTETLAMAKACLSSSSDDASSSNDADVDDEDTKRKCGNERVKYSKDVITALSPDRRRASERESSRVSDSKPWGEVGALSPPLSPPLYLSVQPPFRFRLSYET